MFQQARNAPCKGARDKEFELTRRSFQSRKTHFTPTTSTFFDHSSSSSRPMAKHHRTSGLRPVATTMGSSSHAGKTSKIIQKGSRKDNVRPYHQEGSRRKITSEMRLRWRYGPTSPKPRRGANASVPERDSSGALPRSIISRAERIHRLDMKSKANVKLEGAQEKKPSMLYQELSQSRVPQIRYIGTPHPDYAIPSIERDIVEMIDLTSDDTLSPAPHHNSICATSPLDHNRATRSQMPFYAIGTTCNKKDQQRRAYSPHGRYGSSDDDFYSETEDEYDWCPDNEEEVRARDRSADQTY